MIVFHSFPQEAQDFFSAVLKSPAQKNLLEQYTLLLKMANQDCNLIGRKQDDHRIIFYHLIDSLLPLVDPLPEYFQHIFDIGSGAGLPGILWAIALPERQFYLVEKSPKKCLFLKDTIQKLGLKNVRVLNQRCEDITLRADLIISRAMTSSQDLLNLTKKMRSKKTHIWMYKALLESIEKELSDVDKENYSWVIHPLNHPLKELSRHLIKISALN